MKKSTYSINHPNVIPFPNAATQEEKLQLLLDRLLTIAAAGSLALVLMLLLML